MRVILNPMSRHGAGARFRDVIQRELRLRGVDHELILTRAPGDATRLAREAAEQGMDRVVAAGGDGTLHEVVNGVMQASPARIAVGIIPVGTGNDFVKMVPGTSTPAQAFDTLADGVTTAVDVGVAAWGGRAEYFINAMGTGIDVEVVRQMRRSRILTSGVSYVSALVRALLRYRAIAVEVVVDGTAVSRRIMNLAVCNGPSIGGSFRICPDALIDDGVFDVCLIEELPLLRNARLVPRVLRGTHVGHGGVTMLRGTNVRLRSEPAAPLWFQLDGELRQAEDGAAGVSVSMAPARLDVIRSPAREPVTNR
ncbi:MAG TPA: diacylglycerol kinase family protein [Longimicrobiales bacterium]|nr:diacylglycerol kinase family protein [Longimicrobiales bacterium]